MEAQTALEVSDFLVDLFQVSDSTTARPDRERGRSITAEDILHRGAAKIRTDLHDQAEVQARLMTTIGRVFVNLGLYDEAEVQLREAVSLQTELLGPDDAELASTHRELGRLLRHRDQIDEAAWEYRRAIEVLERDAADNHHELAEALNELGLLLRTSEPEAARNSYQRARDLMVAYNGPEHESLWSLDANIAALDTRAGRLESARDAFESALAGAERALGSNNPRLGALLGNVAFVHRKLGNHRRARQLQERALLLIEENLGAEHPDIGVSLINLATICQRLGDYEAARRYGNRAIEVTQATLPAEHRYVSIALSNHAVTLIRTGDYPQARELVKQAMASLGSRRDEDAVNTRLRHLLMLSRIERLAGHPDEALKLAGEALANRQIGAHGGTAVDARFARAYAPAQLGRTEAQSAFEEARAVADGHPGIQPQNRAYAEALYWALQRNVELSLTQLERAVEAGYRDAVVLTDPDFATVRADQRFARLASRIEQGLSGRDRAPRRSR